MRTSFIDFLAIDGIRLQGLMFEPDFESATIVIHIHGMAGSFYENSFIPIMAKKYTDEGLAFLAFNNRGHDYLCDLERVTLSGTESLMGGAAYESITDSLFDIDGAIAFAKGNSYKNIILQGHSSGANKIVYSLAQKPLDTIGIVLLSPCDDVGLHIDDVGEKRSKLLILAETLVKEGTPEALMPENTFFNFWLSAKTYIEYFKEGSPFDTFPYRDSDNTFSMFSSFSLPIFVSFGTNGEYLLQSPEVVQKILDKKKSPHTTISFNVIDGASHSYTGKEEIIVSKILEWIKTING
jgi:hypothetical protein